MIVIFLAFNHMFLIWSNNPSSCSSLECSVTFSCTCCVKYAP
ncbi:hypothetical protein KC19_12G119200 [Ceratodon purpureus]|uniref:Uncharacterized protein n=1 Tax=Ceratodon purpureus TaxID=3225 RepID=A0A8T0G9Y1_CERPU|nr:hypothetical protein KC19_12G119200 [Ceratodon purpureus]